MRIRLVLISVCLLFLGAKCSGVPYQEDSRFFNSAQAGSYEFPVKVNGKDCKDLDGRLGACVKQLRSNESLAVELPARPYAYRLDLRCSMALGASFPADVQAGQVFKFEIRPEQFSDLLSWTCKGEVFPYDRDQRISAIFHVRVLVVDAQYQAREEIVVQKIHGGQYAVLGAFAKFADICDDEGCRTYSKKTARPVYGSAKIFTESEMMRFNHYGY